MAKMKTKPKIFNTPSDFDKAIEKYKTYCEENKKPFTMIGFAAFMQVDKDTIMEYGRENNKEFSVSYKKALALAENSLVENALLGEYNPTISIFLLKNNHKYKDKTEVESDNTHKIVIERTIKK